MGYFYEFKRHLSGPLRKYFFSVILFVASSYIIIIIIQFTLCRPISRNWWVLFLALIHNSKLSVFISLTLVSLRSFGKDRCDVPENTPGLEIQMATNVFTDFLRRCCVPLFYGVYANSVAYSCFNPDCNHPQRKARTLRKVCDRSHPLDWNRGSYGSSEQIHRNLQHYCWENNP